MAVRDVGVPVKALLSPEQRAALVPEGYRLAPLRAPVVEAPLDEAQAAAVARSDAPAEPVAPRRYQGWRVPPSP